MQDKNTQDQNSQKSVSEYCITLIQREDKVGNRYFVAYPSENVYVTQSGVWGPKDPSGVGITPLDAIRALCDALAALEGGAK